jgi:hypothetical protein
VGAQIDLRGERHLDHVPLLQELQLVEEVAGPAALIIRHDPVQTDLAQH